MSFNKGLGSKKQFCAIRMKLSKSFHRQIFHHADNFLHELLSNIHRINCSTPVARTKLRPLTCCVISLAQYIMFNELNWLSFPKRVHYHTCIMMYKTLHGSATEYTSYLFVKSSEVHNRNLRYVDNETLRIPYARTNIYDRSFAVTGAREWNALPYDIKRSGPIASFKYNLKQYLN